MILKKHKTTDDVLFIDASREFEKDKNQNKLTAVNIQKIVTTYQNRQDVDKYAHVASPAEIKANDYNLNIPRYVDTFEPEPEIDLNQVKADLKQLDEEISQNEQIFNELASQLVTTQVNDQSKPEAHK